MLSFCDPWPQRYVEPTSKANKATAITEKISSMRVPTGPVPVNWNGVSRRWLDCEFSATGLTKFQRVWVLIEGRSNKNIHGQTKRQYSLFFPAFLLYLLPSNDHEKRQKRFSRSLLVFRVTSSRKLTRNVLVTYPVCPGNVAAKWPWFQFYSLVLSKAIKLRLKSLPIFHRIKLNIDETFWKHQQTVLWDDLVNTPVKR